MAATSVFAVTAPASALAMPASEAEIQSGDFGLSVEFSGAELTGMMPFVTVNSSFFGWDIPNQTRLDSTWFIDGVPFNTNTDIVFQGSAVARTTVNLPRESAGHQLSVEVVMTTPDGQTDTVAAATTVLGRVTFAHDGAESRPGLGDTLWVTLDGWELTDGLSTEPGEWVVNCSFQASRNEGAAATYQVKPEDQGCTINAALDFFDANGNSLNRDWASVFIVDPEHPLALSPLGSSMYMPQQTISSTIGSLLYGWEESPWPEGTEFEFQWLLDGQVYVSATTNEPWVALDQRYFDLFPGGSFITVTVTVTVPDGRTDTVSGQRLMLGNINVVSDGVGTPTVGDTLRTTLAGWTLPEGYRRSDSWSLSCPDWRSEWLGELELYQIQPEDAGCEINVQHTVATIDGVQNFGWSTQVTVRHPGDPIFPDVAEDNQFADAIDWLVDQGITQGFDDGTFRPDGTLNRDAMAAFLYRYAGSPEFTAPTTPTFVDVPITHSFYREIEWLAAQQISTGWETEPGSGVFEFRPSDPIERQALAVFLFRFAGEAAANYEAPAVSPFTDVAATDTFYRQISWLADQQISEGWDTDNGREFRPDAQIERQAMATFLHRFDTNVG